MNKKKIIFTILFFALVPARAKIFAQGSKVETTPILIRNDDVNQRLLFEGIDSVLASLSFTRENINVEVDTAKKDTTSVFHVENGNTRIGKFIGKLTIDHLTNSRKILSATSNMEEGIYSVSASGNLCCLPSNIPEQKFSFTRYSKYKTVYDTSSDANEPKSFWDSTAKPILVTLGAITVIALFFLIRG